MIINEQSLDQIKTALRSGNDIETAAHYAGVSIANVYRWLEIGKFESEKASAGEKTAEKNKPYLEFWEELRKARAEAIVRNVAYVQTAAKNGSWQAAAWWLERTVPEQFARTKGSEKKADETQRSISGD